MAEGDCTLKKRYFLSLCSVLIVFILSVFAIWTAISCAIPTSVMVHGPKRQLILDAGHGGEDGGAVSLSGVPESQINLAIVMKMDDILSFYGVSPILLRREDISLHDSGAETLREKKVSDLKNRVSAIQSADGATLISVHQNTYPAGNVMGFQSFYAPTEGSKELAQLIQSAVQDAIQKENRRTAKQIPQNVYLMNHVSCRAVLVECGFLTNQEEEKLLRSESYQRKLATVLSAVWLESEG